MGLSLSMLIIITPYQDQPTGVLNTAGAYVSPVFTQDVAGA